MREIKRIYRAIIAKVRMDPHQMFVYVSDDGNFFPNDTYSRQNPLLPEVLSWEEWRRLQGTILCRGEKGEICRLYPPM